MKVKVNIESTTGSKILTLFDKARDAVEDQKRISKEVGFDSWRHGQFNIAGGFSSVIFSNGIPKGEEGDWKKAFKDTEGEYMPNLRTKRGKELNELFSACKKVENHEIGGAIGIDFGFGRPGFFHYNEFVYLNISDEFIPEVKKNKDLLPISAIEWSDAMESYKKSKGKNQ